MENKKIEKLKEERNQLLSMLDDLNRLTADTEGTNWPEIHRIFKQVDAFKPKVGPLEMWAVKYDNGGQGVFANKDEAERIMTSRDSIHYLREVTPVEWERWDEEKVAELHGERHWKAAFTAVADAHNAEMQRVTGTEVK